MSLLNEPAMFISRTERISPKCKKSLLWKRARDEMLRKAVRADLWTRYSFEDEDEQLLEMDEEYERSIAMMATNGNRPKTESRFKTIRRDLLVFKSQALIRA